MIEESMNQDLKLYTLEDLEKILGVSYRTLLAYMKDGKIKGRKVGKRWMITEKNLKAYLEGE